MTGYDTSPLLMCERTNSTYYDCPVKSFSDASSNGTFTMGVAIHNPSNVQMKKAEIMVPKGIYSAKWYNVTTGMLENAAVEQRCHHDYVELNQVKSGIENCMLFIDLVVPARGHALVEVICDSLEFDQYNEVDDVFGINKEP